MNKNILTPLTDEYLQSLNNIKEAETDPFFYTRLKARIDTEMGLARNFFILKPLWMVSILAVLLVINGFFLATQVKQIKETSSQSTSIQNFATGYDLFLSTSF